MLADFLKDLRRLDAAATDPPWEWVGSALDGGEYGAVGVIEVRDTPEGQYPELQSGELVMANEEPDRGIITFLRNHVQTIAALAEVAQAAETYLDARSLDAQHDNLRTLACKQRHEHELHEALGKLDALETDK